MSEPENILGKVGKRVGEEVKALRGDIDQVAADLANVNVNEVDGDLNVSGKLTAAQLEVAEQRILSKTTVEVADNEIELNKSADGTTTAATAGVAVYRGAEEAAAGMDAALVQTSGVNGPLIQLGTQGAGFTLGEEYSGAFTLSADVAAYLQAIEPTDAAAPSILSDDGAFFVRRLSAQIMAQEAFEGVEVWAYDGNRWAACLFFQEYGPPATDYEKGPPVGGWQEVNDVSFAAMNDVAKSPGSFTAAWTDQSGNYGEWTGTLTYTEGVAGTAGGDKPKARLTWDEAAHTWKAGVGDVLARLNLDGIDTPDGDGVKINGAALGTYADFETELATAKA